MIYCRRCATSRSPGAIAPTTSPSAIGSTAFEHEHESTEVELARADVACRMAKREGRDRIHIYCDSDASLVRHNGEMRLVSRISEALSGGRFRLFA